MPATSTRRATRRTRSARPDFVILGYAAAGRPSASAMAFEALDAREQLMHEYLIDTAVTKDAPPAFLFHADDDPTVPSSASARVYLGYKAAGVPAELHIFRSGGHGFGIRDAVGPVVLWPRLCAEWLRGIGIVPQ
jgi:acetyl esterase/lipase